LAKWPISGPGCRDESGQLNDKGSYEFFFKSNNQGGKTSRPTRDSKSNDKTPKISKYSSILNLILIGQVDKI
jgi:hypothetical protein